MGLITTTKFGVEKHILIANDSYLVSLPCKVTNTGINANSAGRKILKAGTPVAGDITTRDTAFVKATDTAGSNGGAATSNATAIVLHDVDVTDGPANATIVLAGCVDLLKLESDVQALYTAAVKRALPRIIAVKGSAI